MKKNITIKELERQLDEAVKSGILVKKWNNKLQEFTWQDARYAKRK